MHAKKFVSSAGSFYIGARKPKAIVSYIHFGGEANCGGGNALSPEKINETAGKAKEFVKWLGWNSAAEKVEAQLRKMVLSAEPEQHALLLQKYYAEELGIKNHSAVLHNLESGEQKVLGKKAKKGRGIVHVACADARHDVSGTARKQEKQNPSEGFYFGRKKVSKDTHNKVFTIAGMSERQVKKLLMKAEKGQRLSALESHDLAAVMLSAYYFIEHNWKGYEALNAMLANKK